MPSATHNACMARRRGETGGEMLEGYINNVEDGVSDPGYDFDEREDE